jgi:hypothetical protein
VAKLADAQPWGGCARKGMGVQVSPSAPEISRDPPLGDYQFDCRRRDYTTFLFSKSNLIYRFKEDSKTSAFKFGQILENLPFLDLPRKGAAQHRFH